MSRFFSFLFLICGIAVQALGAGFEVPALTGPIVDQVGIFSATEKNQLGQLLQQFNQSGQAQVQILVVDSLQGEPIEMASIKVTDQWKLGDAKKDNGVLLLVALGDRKLRIEVGQGLEGELTDLKSSRIIRDVMVPLLKSGKSSKAVAAGIYEIFKILNPDFLSQHEDFKPVKKSKSSVWLILGLLLFVVLFGRRGPGGRYYGGGGGGFGGGFGGGGGGWSGGGGGFSGGGSSGSW
ncbi:MAG: TPM domain-containing protein [Pseudobdellovibrionaceae bacterium]